MKNIYIIGAICFFVQVHGMDLLQLPQDIRCCMQSFLSLQDKSRIKQSSQQHARLYDVERPCPFAHQLECSTYACSRLAENYYACSKALGHFASKENEHVHNEQECQKDKNMFKHLWTYHAIARGINLDRVMKEPVITINQQMEAYRKYYNRDKEIQQQMLKDVVVAINNNDSRQVKVILLGGSFDIFALLSKRMGNFNYHPNDIFSQASSLDDIELIKALCAGTVDSQGLKYIMRCISEEKIVDLIIDNVLPAHMMDKTEKSVLHYAAEYGYPTVIHLVLDKGVYINCMDKAKNTPLYYAIQRENIDAIRALLLYKGVDIRFAYNKVKKTCDYLISKFLQYDVEELAVLKAIHKELEDYSKRHAQEDNSYVYSHAKVHRNGYQRLH